MKIQNILLGILVFGLSACQSLFDVDRAGLPVVFSAAAGEDVQTKTSYSGKVVNGKERIDWVFGDKVRVYMYWRHDGNQPENVGYGVYDAEYWVKAIHPDGVESHGSLSTLNVSDQLSWRPEANAIHAFYSVYPPDMHTIHWNQKQWGGENTDAVTLKFSLPSTQDGDLSRNMQYAYMAAVGTQKTYSSSEAGSKSVELRYFPMVTTLFLTFNNDTNKDFNLKKVVLSIPGGKQQWVNGWYQKPLVGEYDAQNKDGQQFVTQDRGDFQEGSNSVELFCGEEGITIKQDESYSAAIFIRPRQYDVGSLLLSIESSFGKIENYLSNNRVSTFMPCKKYNLTINLSGANTPVEPDEPIEPEPNPADMNDALAELVFSVMLANGGAYDSYEKLKDFWRSQYGYTSGDDLTKGIWKKLDEARNAPLKDMEEIMKDIFGDKLDILFAYMGTLKDIEIPNGYRKLSADTVDLSIFKSAENIRFHMPQDMTVYITGLQSLKTFTIIGGSNGNMSLIINDCSIETIGQEEGNDGARIKKLHLIDTPKFRSAKIKNNNLLEMDIYLKDCSTEVQNAYIEIENTNTKKNVTRAGNTSNVTVRP